MTQPPDSKGPRPLDYAPPSGRGPAGGVRFIWQMAIGAGALIVAVGLSISLNALAMGMALMPPVGSLAAVGHYLIFGGLVAVNILAVARWRWPGFVAGCVTTVGLALLVGIGACFYMISHIGH